MRGNGRRRAVSVETVVDGPLSGPSMLVDRPHDGAVNLERSRVARRLHHPPRNTQQDPSPDREKCVKYRRNAAEPIRRLEMKRRLAGPS